MFKMIFNLNPVFDPFWMVYNVRVVEKTDSGSGPDFRLTRSPHPSASGKRIGSPPGGGWAARRDPQANSGVFYKFIKKIRYIRAAAAHHFHMVRFVFRIVLPTS
jgi:hypothetical protein